MIFWMDNRRAILFLVGVGIILQLVSFWFVSQRSAAEGLEFPNLTGDAGHYLNLAKNLLARGEFDTYVAGLSPESVRTPGYPAILVILMSIGRDWNAAILLQSFLSILGPILAYFIGKRLFGPSAGFLAGILFLFDPIRLFYSNVSLSDTAFTVALLFSISLFLRALYAERHNFWWFFFAGAALGFAALIRPIGQFLLILFLLPLIFLRVSWKKLGLAMLALLLGSSLFIAPWAVRNKAIFNTWQLSTVSSLNAGYFAILYTQQKTGASIDELRERLRMGAGSDDPYFILTFKGAPYNMRFAKKVFFEDPWGYAKFHVVKTVPFFLNDGLRDISRTLRFESKPLPNITSLLMKGNIGELWSQIKTGGRDTLFLILGSSAMGVIAILSLIALFAGFRSPSVRWKVIFLFSIILYFAILTGPVANARYRMPAMPLLLILASHAITWITGRAKSLPGQTTP